MGENNKTAWDFSASINTLILAPVDIIRSIGPGSPIFQAGNIPGDKMASVNFIKDLLSWPNADHLLLWFMAQRKVTEIQKECNMWIKRSDKVW